MNTKIILALGTLLAMLLMVACKPKSDDSPYRLLERATQTSSYEYDEGNISKITHKIVTIKYGKDDKILESKEQLQEFRQYGVNDSLLQIDTYVVDSDNKTLVLSEKYSDNNLESIRLSPFGDSMVYDSYIRDEMGRDIEIYSKISQGSKTELQLEESQVFESSISHEYDKNRLIRSVYLNMNDQTQEVRTYRYITKGDTLITEVRLDGFLDHEKKCYSTPEFEVEAIKYFNIRMNDTVFYQNGKEAKAVSYDNTSKRITFIEYDDKGNMAKSINEVWELKQTK